LEDSERASVRHWQRCRIRLDHVNQIADCARAPAMRPPPLSRSLSAVMSSSIAPTATASVSSSVLSMSPGRPLLERSESTPLPYRDAKVIFSCVYTQM
jgi:hypothetical protein